MTDGRATLTPRAEHTLARASEFARDRGHDYLGTEHILLALLDDPHGIAGRVLHRLGCAEVVRDEVIRIIESDGYARPTSERGHEPPERDDRSTAE